MTCSRSCLTSDMSNSISVTEFVEGAHEHQKGKVCSSPKCTQHNPQPLSEFCKDKNSTDGLKWMCKSCAKEYDANRCPFKKWFQKKKFNSQSAGKEFTIEPEDIPGVKIEWYNIRKRGSRDTWRGIKYPKVCPVFKMKLDWGMHGLQNNSPSLDRIDPTKGYIPGNVMMMSDIANRMKSNATPEQLKQFCRYYLFGDNK